MSRASGGSNASHWIGNNIHDFQGTMFVKIMVGDGKICNNKMIGERL